MMLAPRTTKRQAMSPNQESARTEQVGAITERETLLAALNVASPSPLGRSICT